MRSPTSATSGRAPSSPSCSRGPGEATDRYTRVRLLWSLGRLSLEQAKPQAALDSFRRAVALLEATEDTVHLARAHMACAEATIAAGDDEIAAAEQHLLEAERLLGSSRPRRTSPRSGGCRRSCAAARRRVRRGGAPRLGALAAPALELPSERGQRVVGDRGGAGGRRRSDRRRCLPARRSSCSASTGRCASYASVLRSYGRYLRDAGREREALDVLERAADVAANLQGEPTTAERLEA